MHNWFECTVALILFPIISSWLHVCDAVRPLFMSDIQEADPGLKVASFSDSLTLTAN